MGATYTYFPSADGSGTVGAWVQEGSAYTGTAASSTLLYAALYGNLSSVVTSTVTTYPVGQQWVTLVQTYPDEGDECLT